MRRPFRRGEAAAYYEAILAEQRRSGLSLPRFAALRGLGVATLRRWRRELGATPGKRGGASMVAVNVLDDDAAPNGVDGFEVRLPSGAVVFVPPTFEENALRRLLGALAS